MRIQTKLLIAFMGVSALIIVAYSLISLYAYRAGLENELRNRAAKGIELVLSRFQDFRENARPGAQAMARDRQLRGAFRAGQAPAVFARLEKIRQETGVEFLEISRPGQQRARLPGPNAFESADPSSYLSLPDPGENASLRLLEDGLYILFRSGDESAGKDEILLAGYRVDEGFMDRMKVMTGFDVVLYQNNTSLISTVLGPDNTRLKNVTLDQDFFEQLQSIHTRDIKGVYILREQTMQDIPFQAAYAPLFPNESYSDQYYLLSAFPIDYVKEEYRANVLRALGIAAVVLVIALLVSLIMARGISRPITTLSERMRAIRFAEAGPEREGAIASDSAPESKDELKILAGSFDQMLETVQGSRRVIEDYAEGLEKKVTERTRDVREKMEQIEKSRTALESEIEERRKTEKELLLARDKAELADRAKSQFLAIMSHEIRTPMNSILGMADLLAETELTSEQRRYIEIFKGSGDALIKIINDILDISRVELGDMRIESAPFDPYDLIHNIIVLLNDRFKTKNLRFVQEISANVPRRLKGDASRLRQVLLNLLDNALKFTDRGEIHLSVNRTDSPDTFVRGKCPLRFRISDTGIGIQPDKIMSIFERFTQADSSTTRGHGGTGLGLAIVQRLVEMMGGAVRVQSAPGQGSTFEFELDFEIVSDEPPLMRTAPPARLDLSRRRVLLVEDNEDNILLVELFLQKAGVELDIARNGQEGLKKFDQENAYDLVLMDIQMPVMDGFTATREIREREQTTGSHVPIVALTAYALKEEIQRCYDAGCDRHYVKPIKKQELMELIAWVGTREN